MPTLNNNSNIHYVKFIRGSITAWENLLQTPERVDDDTLYFIYENIENPTEGKLYLGQKLISGTGGSYTGDININDIGDVFIDDESLENKQILVYNETTQQWENTSLSNIINTAVGEMTGATAAADGAAGLVPAPQAGDQQKFLRGDGTWATVNIPTFDEDIFSINNPNTVTLSGFSNAPVGYAPVKGENGIEWRQSSSGALSRHIVTQLELDDLIASGRADENTIYMIAKSDGSNTDRYEEFLVINGVQEFLGTFGQVDLNNYVTNSVFQSTVQNLQNILNDTIDSSTGNLIPGLITRVSIIEDNYIKKADIGDLSTLLISPENTSETLVEEVNIINERLTWQELVIGS